MKKILLNIAFVGAVLSALASCEPNKIIVNRQVESTKDGLMLLGNQTLDQFKKEPFSTWYDKEYADYALDEASIAQLKKEKLKSYQIIVFLGTWCEDSHREFPRLIKILEATKYPTEKLKIIALNRKRESPSGEESMHNIQKVPTIILRKYGTEVGRIVEAPKSGYIEKDLLQILQKNNSSIKDLFK